MKVLLCLRLVAILVVATLLGEFAPTLPAHAANAWSHAQVVDIVMVDNQFRPDHATFKQGIAYELRLQNRGKDLHEFTAPDFFHSATMRDKRQLSNGGIEVVVQPGTSTQVFLIPRVKGDFSLSCADHDWDGMVGHIKVD